MASGAMAELDDFIGDAYLISVIVKIVNLSKSTTISALILGKLRKS